MLSANKQLAEMLAALPESSTLEEAFERLYRAFQEKQRATKGAQAVLALINQERIAEARELVTQTDVPSAWSGILAPPVARVADGASGGGIASQTSRIQPELARYAGQWVATRDGQIVGSDPSRSALRGRLKDSGLLANSVFIKVALLPGAGAGEEPMLLFVPTGVSG